MPESRPGGFGLHNIPTSRGYIPSLDSDALELRFLLRNRYLGERSVV